VLKPDPHGENWAIFQICFQNMMEVKEKWGHFDEMMKHPTEVEKAVE